MATVTTSIGNDSSITTGTPSSSSGSGPYSTTFSSAPSGVSVGDIFVVTDEVTTFGTYTYLVESIAGAVLSLRYITDTAGYMGGATAPDNVLDISYSPASGTFKRAYSTMTAWEADLDNSDFYSSSDDAVGEAFADANFNESFTINGGGTVGLSSVKLSSNNSAGNRHDGTAGSGVKIRYSGGNTSTIQVSRNNVTIEFIEFDMSAGSNSNNRACQINTGAYEDIIFRSNIIHDLIGSFPIAVRADGGNSSSDTRYVHNNICYDINDNDDRVKFFLHNGDYPVKCWNNTTYLIRTGRADKDALSFFSWASPATMELKNNLAIMTSSTGTAGFASNYTSSSDYNASDQSSTTGGANDLTSQTTSEFVSVTSGSEDLHLAESANCVEAGVDLGSTAGVDIDIDGETRGAWSIGADRPEPTDIAVTPTAISAVIKTEAPTIEIVEPVTPAAISVVVSTVSPTASQDSLTLTPSAISVVFSTVAPTADLASLTIEPSAISSVVGTPAPTVVLASHTVDPGSISVAVSTIAPTISTDVVVSATISVVVSTVDPSIGGGIVFEPVSAISAVISTTVPTVKAENVTVTPASSVIYLDTIAPTIVTDSVIVDGPIISAIFVAPSPDVIMDSVSLAVNPISVIISTTDPTETTETVVVFVSAGTIACAIGSQTPVVVLGDLTASPARIDCKVDTINPTYIQTSVTLTPSTISLVISTTDPTEVGGSISVVPAARTIVISTMAPSVSLGSLTASPNAIIANVDTATPTITITAIEVTPPVISAVISVVDPTSAQASMILEPIISVVTSTLSPTISTGSITLTPDSISCVLSVPDIVLIVPPFFTIKPRRIGFGISTVNPSVNIYLQTSKGLEFTLATNRLDYSASAILGYTLALNRLDFTTTNSLVDFTLNDNRLEYTLKD
jgi:hypothetical protein